MLCLQRYNYVVWYNNIGVVIKVTSSMFVWCVWQYCVLFVVIVVHRSVVVHRGMLVHVQVVVCKGMLVHMIRKIRMPGYLK